MPLILNITSPVTLSFKTAVNLTGLPATMDAGSVVSLTLIVKSYLTT